jgi:hypothetical protein
MIEIQVYLLQMSKKWNLEAIVTTQWLIREMSFLVKTILVVEVIEEKISCSQISILAHLGKNKSTLFYKNVTKL